MRVRNLEATLELRCVLAHNRIAKMMKSKTPGRRLLGTAGSKCLQFACDHDPAP